MGKKHKKHHKKVSEAKVKAEEPPIKLVLKVSNTERISEQRSKEQVIPPEVHKSKEHSSKRKKKKRSASKEHKKRKHLEATGNGADSSSALEIIHDSPKKKTKFNDKKDLVQAEKPLIKKIHIKPIEPPKDYKKTKSTVFRDDEPAPIMLALTNLHQTLQRKDLNGFFAYPVNDVIAPGYSSIITNPVDFSSMKYKIDRNVYSSLEYFRDDFNLMCHNAMVYNTPDTIYFKTAKKMQQTGAKLMSDDKLRNLYRAMGLLHDEELAYGVKRHDDKSSEELIDVDTVDNSATPLLRAPPPKKRDNRTRKKNTVNQRLLAKAEEAARRAAEKLAKRCPNSNLGFLRKDSNGNTTLAILNPCSVDSPKSIPVNLGGFTGKLSTGSLTTALFQEDKKNKATPVNYLKYGPFSSFSPSFDSSNATITKEDSDLLYRTYGDSNGTYYAQSIQAFVKDNLFAKDFVDCLLDSLTAGGHSKLMDKFKEKLLEEERERQDIKLKKEQEDKDKKKAAENLANKKTENNKEPSTKDVDFDALLSLEKDGIDMSFLINKGNEKYDKRDSEVQDKLDETADLITKLDAAQSQRLSQANNDDNGATPKSALVPSEIEQSIAEKVTLELAKLTSKIQPKDVTDTESVRKAVGVGDVSEYSRKALDEQEEMEVHLAAEAIETVFNETTTMEDLDKVICEAAREVEDAMGLDVLDDLTASLNDVKGLEGL